MNSVNTFTGKQAFIEYYASLEKDVMQGDFYYAFAFQNEYQSEEVRQGLMEFHSQLAKKIVDDRAIFNEKNRAIATETYKDNTNLQIKFKEVKIPVGLVITKDRVLQLAWQPEPFIIEIKNKNLIKHYHSFFLQNWNTNKAIELTNEVLNRFSINYKESSLGAINNLRDNKPAQLTADEIEKVEEEWSYEFKGQERAFGQKVVGETIKLWSVPRSTAELLEFLVVATDSKQILEIGTSAGYSTLYLAMGSTYTGGQVTTIEKLKPKAKLARKHFKKSLLNNIELIEGDAYDTLRLGKLKEIDLVFLDADKENYDKYFDLVMPLLKKGGFIIADNVFDYGHMMKPYLDKVLGTKLPGSQSDPRVESYTLPLDNGVLITRKVKS